MKRKRASKEPPAPLTFPAVLRASMGDYFVCALLGVIALFMLPGSLLGSIALGFGPQAGLTRRPWGLKPRRPRSAP